MLTAARLAPLAKATLAADMLAVATAVQAPPPVTTVLGPPEFYALSTAAPQFRPVVPVFWFHFPGLMSPLQPPPEGPELPQVEGPGPPSPGVAGSASPGVACSPSPGNICLPSPVDASCMLLAGVASVPRPVATWRSE
ncbi:UNVERIFIED_CONTAM: hypothetical protein FKN15_047700 [Acipenser sinensis]